MAMVPSPVASGPITRPIASIDNKEKTAEATLSASTQLGERAPGRRIRNVQDHPKQDAPSAQTTEPLPNAERTFDARSRPVVGPPQRGFRGVSCDSERKCGR